MSFNNLFEITFIDSNKTVEKTRKEAIKLLGRDVFNSALAGHEPHIVCVGIA